MRPGQQNNKRMRGRGRKGPNPLSRSYESNGPDVKIRGTAQHIAEKYAALARDATSAGDRVMAENYFQHAEHYGRIVAAAQGSFQPAQAERDYDSDEDEAEDGAPEAQGRQDHRNNGQYRERGEGREGQYRDGQRDQRDQRERNGYRERDRREGPAGSGPQPYAEGREDGAPFGQRSRDDRGPRRERRFEDRGQRRGEGDYEPRERDEARADERVTPDAAPSAPRAEESASAETGAPAHVAEAATETPRRRGRPRRQPLAEATNAEVPSAEPESPSSVSADAPVQPEAEAAPAPKRRGRPPRAAKPAEEAPAQEAAAEAPVKRRPGRPRKKRPEDEAEGEPSMPAFLLASNG